MKVCMPTLVNPGNVHGSCHCGAVRFSAQLDLSGAFRCNCSICLKSGATVATCAPSAFTLTAGEADLVEYKFGPSAITRLRCRHCGIQCFARVTLPDGSPAIGVNVNTLDDAEVSALPVVYFDGRRDRFEPQSAPVPVLP
jgi:hypothetical protein